jgi:hypothetical protein
MLLVGSKARSQLAKMYVPAPLLSAQELTFLFEKGWADFKCNAQSVSVWVNKDAPQLKEFQK